jgi:dTDP-4-amino-4,6-dideoxygalactose transaminase
MQGNSLSNRFSIYSYFHRYSRQKPGNAWCFENIYLHGVDFHRTRVPPRDTVPCMTTFRDWRKKHSRIDLLVPLVPSEREIRKYLKEIDKTRIYTNFGPLNEKLVSRVANHLSVPGDYIQTAANATLAIQGAISTCTNSSNAWQVPSWTFAASLTAALNAGVDVDLVDVELESWRATFDSRTKFALDVLPFGDDLDLARIPSSIDSVVIDAAASMISLENCGLPSDKRIGVIISLHATKLLPAGEGAIFFTNDLSWSKRFRQWTNFGFDQNRISNFLGNNAKMSEYNSAVALASMDSLRSQKVILEKNSERARVIASKHKFEVHPAMTKKLINPYWIAKFDSRIRRDEVHFKFQEDHLPTRHWWLGGCHSHPAFANLLKRPLPNTEKLASTTLGLPFHSFMGPKDFESIDHSLSTLS